jgi:cell division protein FtsL
MMWFEIMAFVFVFLTLIILFVFRLIRNEIQETKENIWKIDKKISELKKLSELLKEVDDGTSHKGSIRQR